MTGNLPRIEERADEVVQVTFGDEQWHGLWHVVRDGSVARNRLGRTLPRSVPR
jgi:hypothetical protein